MIFESPHPPTPCPERAGENRTDEKVYPKKNLGQHFLKDKDIARKNI